MKKELCLKDTGMAYKNQRNSQTTWVQDGHITEPLQGSQKQEEWTFSQETTFAKKDSWRAKSQSSDMAPRGLPPLGCQSQTLGSIRKPPQLVSTTRMMSLMMSKSGCSLCFRRDPGPWRCGHRAFQLLRLRF